MGYLKIKTTVSENQIGFFDRFSLQASLSLTYDKKTMIQILKWFV